MRAPISISIDELQKNLSQSVASALREMPDLRVEDSTPAFFPEIGTIGFILRDFDAQRFAVADAHKLSARVTDSFGRGSPITVLRDDDIIFGFFPLEQRF